MKKGRHRRFEEARALKRSHDVDYDGILEDLSPGDGDDEIKPEHAAWGDLASDASDDDPWADVAAEFEASQGGEGDEPEQESA